MTKFRPSTDTKKRPSAAAVGSLAERMQRGRDDIIERWRSLVLADPGVPSANRLEEPVLRDHIPSFIDEVIASLSSARHEVANEDGDLLQATVAVADRVGEGASAKQHAKSRNWEGYALSEALRELGNLRTAIVEVCLEGEPDRGVTVLVHASLDRAMATVAHEIAGLREAERLSRVVADQQLQLLTKNLKDYAIFLTDTDMKVTSWNQGAERIFGYSEKDILGRNAAIIFTPEDCAKGCPASEMTKAIDAGRAEDKRWHLRKDGGRFWADGMLFPLREDSGSLIGFAKILRDKTEQRRADEERERLLKELQEKTRAVVRAGEEKDAFLATLSHELRNPLGAIVGYGEILRDDGQLKDHELVRESVEIITRNGEVALQLVNDLLDIARISAGKLAVDMRPIRMDSVVHAALATIQLTAKNKGIDLKVVVPDVRRVYGDPSRVQQIVWNLLTNAIKFTPRGGHVDVRLTRLDSQVVLVVRDSGKGIAPEFLPFVFEKFKQENLEIVRRQGGLGLGLALVKQLVLAHQGTVVAESDGVGQGSTFTVTLPAAD